MGPGREAAGIYGPPGRKSTGPAHREGRQFPVRERDRGAVAHHISVRFSTVV
jgi:hypothetical protein